MIYRLIGYDTFAGEYYPLGEFKRDNGATIDGMKPCYDTRDEALEDAWERLDDLERTQPTGGMHGPGSGGQGRFGIQDRVFIVHPDGYRERVWPRSSQENQQVTKNTSEASRRELAWRGLVGELVSLMATADPEELGRLRSQAPWSRE